MGLGRLREREGHREPDELAHAHVGDRASRRHDVHPRLHLVSVRVRVRARARTRVRVRVRARVRVRVRVSRLHLLQPRLSLQRKAGEQQADAQRAAGDDGPVDGLLRRAR